MAKLSSINQNQKRKEMAKSFFSRRKFFNDKIKCKDTSFEERMGAMISLSELPRNSSRTRYRNRCLISGRPRGFHRKFEMSRIALRELGSVGLIPGLVKSSW